MGKVAAAYEKLLSDSKQFYEAHKSEIDAENDRERAELIAAEMPGLLAKGLIVWCRNGSVCDVATRCDELLCRYKSNPSDIADGTSKCDAFQVTRYSIDWDHAEHVDAP